MDITALLSQNLAKTGPAGQPAAADGDAFAGSLRNAAAKLLAAPDHNGATDQTTLALLDAGGDHQINGEASDALRHALETLAGSQLKTGAEAEAQESDALADLDASRADHGLSGGDTDKSSAESAAPIGADNPLVGGLAVAAPLTAAGSTNAAQDLPVMRAPDALTRVATQSGGPADGITAHTLTPAPATIGEAKPALPAWAADAQAMNGTLDRSRLETRLGANQEGGAHNAGVLGATGAATGQTGAAGGTASPATAFTLQAPVASAPWQQQLGQQMVGLAQRGDQQMELHLNPRELGPLSVSLKLDDQGAQAHFFSSHSTVRGAVEQAIPQLREALAEQGIALGEAMVGEHRQGFAGNGDGQPGEQGRSAGGGGLAGESVGGVEESVPVNRIIGGDTGGVDLYA
ncbi:MAG TPA: hypothetical protein EYG00_14695 [Alcanivorax sp.]|nr:hypothetical protein [Alcanivorax sp.]